MPQRKPKCARCSHPAGKHASGPRGGCTVRVVRNTGSGRPQFRPCTCMTYQAPADVSRETETLTVAELIALDQARLAGKDT